MLFISTRKPPDLRQEEVKQERILFKDKRIRVKMK